VKGQDDDELIAVKPTIIQFPMPNIIIVKVACGLTYSLALTSSETGFVFSWG
jgi:alpha-tubulin suppressor-like RCC1 family protein